MDKQQLSIPHNHAPSFSHTRKETLSQVSNVGTQCSNYLKEIILETLEVFDCVALRGELIGGDASGFSTLFQEVAGVGGWAGGVATGGSRRGAHRRRATLAVGTGKEMPGCRGPGVRSGKQSLPMEETGGARCGLGLGCQLRTVREACPRGRVREDVTVLGLQMHTCASGADKLCFLKRCLRFARCNNLKTEKV